MKTKALAFTLAVTTTIATFASHANADISPPSKANDCILLPHGATCYVGNQRGTCDHQPDHRDRQWSACRIGLPASDASTSEDGGEMKDDAPPKKKSGCEIGNTGAGNTRVVSHEAWLLIALACIALTRRRVSTEGL